MVPLLVILIFGLPYLASFFYNTHRRVEVFDELCNSAMWMIYLIYPLLCIMTIQGFSCVTVEGMRLLSADMSEPCPWDANERSKSAIFPWTCISTLLYPVGIPFGLLVFLLRLDVPRFVRHGEGESIFLQMVYLYDKHKNCTVASRIAVSKSLVCALCLCTCVASFAI